MYLGLPGDLVSRVGLPAPCRDIGYATRKAKTHKRKMKLHGDRSQIGRFRSGEPPPLNRFGAPTITRAIGNMAPAVTRAIGNPLGHTHSSRTSARTVCKSCLRTVTTTIANEWDCSGHTHSYRTGWRKESSSGPVSRVGAPGPLK